MNVVTAKRNFPGRAAMAVAVAVFAGSQATAGGHFDVDDAYLLDPGQCQYETWLSRTRVEPARNFHFGPACRLGPFEVGIAFDRSSTGQSAAESNLGPQIKWAFFGGSEAPFSAAVAWSTTRNFSTHGKPGRQLLLPLTWRGAENLRVHANLGADWSTGDSVRTSRRGAAVEWALLDDRLSLIAERNRAHGLWTSRLGARLHLTPLVSLDISAARSSPDGARMFVVGLNQEFSR
ncbi:MAG: hypothetical protein WKG52_09270 [Variovorax sp.]